MPPSLPSSVKHLVVGAGVHGLSTAWHLAKAGEDLPDIGALDLEAAAPAGIGLQRAAEPDLDHHSAALAILCASIAASTFGGDIGKSVRRMPTACDTAFAMAASGGTIEVSPTPRTP